MTKVREMRFCREVDAARLRTMPLAGKVNTHQQHGEVVLDIGNYKVLFRTSTAAMPDSIRFQLDQNKAMTLRLDKGRVRILNLTAVGPSTIQPLKDWIPVPDFLALFETEEAQRAWRTLPASQLGIEKILATVLKAPAFANHS